MTSTPYGPCEHGDNEARCPNCGGDAEWVECDALGCEAGTYDAYEDDPIFYQPGETEDCPQCNGDGGWFYCPACEYLNEMVKQEANDADIPFRP